MRHTILPIENIAGQMSNLTGRETTVSKAIKADALLKQDKIWLASYDDSEGDLAAVVAMDLSLACFNGAALSMMPVGGAEDSIQEGKLEGTLYDNYYEVVNVMAGILNNQGARLILKSAKHISEVPDATKAFVTNAAKSEAAELEVMGYGKGQIGTYVQ